MRENVNVLFLDKNFLRKKPCCLRGVECFNLALLEDLGRLGCSLTVPAHVSWKDVLQERAPRSGSGETGKGRLDVLEIKGVDYPFLASLVVLFRLSFRRFDVLYQGNVAKCLGPAIRAMRGFGIWRRSVLMAHRNPTPRFARSQRGSAVTVLAVNAIIAETFRAAGHRDVDVYFGLPNASAFKPGLSGKHSHFRIGVVGYLDNAWKGADTAVSAFRALSPATSQRSELHLLSYQCPPTFEEENITCYPWLSDTEIPRLMQTFDLLVVPSRDEEEMRETFCFAAVQGMLTGLPLLVSEVPVLREKVEHGGGYVFHDVNHLTEWIERLAGDEALCRNLGQEGREIALQRYIWNSDEFMMRYLLPEKSDETKRAS